MKKLKGLLVIAVVFFALTSYKKAAPSIMGYWEIYMTVKDGNTENERNMAMVFSSEGKLELISKKRGETLNGKWKLKKNGKVVKISFDNKEADHGNYKVESLTHSQMILEKSGNKVYFDRGQNSEAE